MIVCVLLYVLLYIGLYIFMHVCMYGCVYESLNDFVRFIYTYMAESQKYFILNITYICVR
jgi:hypothetical protein